MAVKKTTVTENKNTETVKPARKTAAAKKTVEKTVAAPEKTAEVVKEEVKKPAVKKVAAPECKVFVEYEGRQFAARSIVDQAIESFKANHEEAVKTIEVYVKPEEGAAYYVINGEGSDDYKISL